MSAKRASPLFAIKQGPTAPTAAGQSLPNCPTAKFGPYFTREHSPIRIAPSHILSRITLLRPLLSNYPTTLSVGGTIVKFVKFIVQIMSSLNSCHFLLSIFILNPDAILLAERRSQQTSSLPPRKQPARPYIGRMFNVRAKKTKSVSGAVGAINAAERRRMSHDPHNTLTAEPK